MHLHPVSRCLLVLCATHTAVGVAAVVTKTGVQLH